MTRFFLETVLSEFTCAMKEPLAMLNTCTSACCCIMCMLTCACGGCFLHRNNYVESTTRARSLYMSCMASIVRLNREDKKLYLLDKFRTFQVNVTEAGIYKFVMIIGEGDSMHLVCRRGFARAYSISHWYIDDIVTRLKRGDVNCLSDFNAKTSFTNNDDVSLKQLAKFADKY